MTNKQALRVPERKKHNWGQALMRDCDFCQQWALTVNHNDGGSICASCCDSEYTADLKATLATALERMEAAEKRIAEMKELLQWSHDTLLEINPSNYTHDDVCEANAAAVEVILGIAPTLGETHGKANEWWESRAAGIRINGEG